MLTKELVGGLRGRSRLHCECVQRTHLKGSRVAVAVGRAPLEARCPRPRRPVLRRRTLANARVSIQCAIVGRGSGVGRDGRMQCERRCCVLRTGLERRHAPLARRSGRDVLGSSNPLLELHNAASKKSVQYHS